METAEWVVRVLEEAEPLSTACKLAVRQEAYGLALEGMPKRTMLTKFCNDLFFTSAWSKADFNTAVKEMGT
jgi:hypothetical protein